MNEQRKQILASQASGEYLMSHIAGVMDMVQDLCASQGDTLDEETLVSVEAHVKFMAEALIHQEQEQRVRVLAQKKTPPLYMQRHRDDRSM